MLPTAHTATGLRPEAYLIRLLLLFSFLFLIFLKYILIILLKELVELWISIPQFVQRFVKVLFISLFCNINTGDLSQKWTKHKKNHFNYFQECMCDG